MTVEVLLLFNKMNIWYDGGAESFRMESFLFFSTKPEFFIKESLRMETL
jgi:hypothetical protein